MDFYEREEKDKIPPFRLEQRHIRNVYHTNNQWGLSGLLLKVFGNVQDWILIQTPCHDTKVRFTLPLIHHDSFTPSIINRFLAIFRKYYKAIVLLEFETPQQKEKRIKRELKACDSYRKK